MSTWIKWQVVNCRMREDYSLTVEQARDKYAALITEPSVFFAQWGVKTDEGSIVLGELRRE